MRFTLIDGISDVQAGRRITAVKVLSPTEEYLRDHFPLFPVMPGVLMLEAMYQASAWLVSLTEDFQHSTVLLKEARNVKFADFVQPGQTLVVEAELLRMDESTAALKASGSVDGRLAASGRLVLERWNVGDRLPQRSAWDEYARQQMRRQFTALQRPQPTA